METRYDSALVSEERLIYMNGIKQRAEELAQFIEQIPMDGRLGSMAQSDLENFVLHAVKGVAKAKNRQV